MSGIKYLHSSISDPTKKTLLEVFSSSLKRKRNYSQTFVKLLIIGNYFKHLLKVENTYIFIIHSYLDFFYVRYSIPLNLG